MRLIVVFSVLFVCAFSVDPSSLWEVGRILPMQPVSDTEEYEPTASPLMKYVDSIPQLDADALDSVPQEVYDQYAEGSSKEPKEGFMSGSEKSSDISNSINQDSQPRTSDEILFESQQQLEGYQKMNVTKTSSLDSQESDYIKNLTVWGHERERNEPLGIGQTIFTSSDLLPSTITVDQFCNEPNYFQSCPDTFLRIGDFCLAASDYYSEVPNCGIDSAIFSVMPAMSYSQRRLWAQKCSLKFPPAACDIDDNNITSIPQNITQESLHRQTEIFKSTSDQCPYQWVFEPFEDESPPSITLAPSDPSSLVIRNGMCNAPSSYRGPCKKSLRSDLFSTSDDLQFLISVVCFVEL